MSGHFFFRSLENNVVRPCRLLAPIISILFFFLFLFSLHFHVLDSIFSKPQKISEKKTQRKIYKLWPSGVKEYIGGSFRTIAYTIRHRLFFKNSIKKKHSEEDGRIQLEFVKRLVLVCLALEYRHYRKQLDWINSNRVSIVPKTIEKVLDCKLERSGYRFFQMNVCILPIGIDRCSR